MRYVLAAVSALLFGMVAAVGTPAGVSLAAFHCMRIHAVKAGFNGNANVQYVELRMDLGSQSLIAGHTIQFLDGAGTLKATFTVPANIVNASTGDSILIGTSEFNAAVQGGMADFTFTNANTVGANGGDPLHPIQAPSGKVVWAPGSLNCSNTAPVDSLASGTAAADYGTAAGALTGATDVHALRLNNLNLMPTNNSTEYTLSAVSTTSFAVPSANLASDLSTPRNNGRIVLAMVPSSPSVGGIADIPSAATVRPKDGRGSDLGWYLGIAGILFGLAAVSLFVVRRRG